MAADRYRATCDTRQLPLKKRRCRFSWKWFLLSLLALLILGCLAVWYFNLCPSVTNRVTGAVKEQITALFPPRGDASADDLSADTGGEPQLIMLHSTDTIWIDKLPTDTASVQPADTAQAAAAQASVFDRKREYNTFISTETINSGNTLTRIALKYYGHKSFWVYIYEANRDRIAHPDKLPAGFAVKIPKLPFDLVDANNPECIKYAVELDKKYTGKQ
jgi:phage tail protein X